MGHAANPHIKHLAAKLLSIRQHLALSQHEFARLHLPTLKGGGARLCEFEHGRRTPNVLVLLDYAHAAEIPLENIIDDAIDLIPFRESLNREAQTITNRN